MSATTTRSLADRFTWLIDGLCRVIGADAHRRRMEAALAWSIWNRVRVLGEQLIALAERVEAGRFRGRRENTPHPGPLPQRDREQHPPDAANEPPASLPAASLPQEFGWMPRMLPQTAQFAGVLAYMLRDPEVAALAAKAPRQARRILRPLCHLLGVKTPEFLRRALNSPPPQAAANDAGSVSEAAPPPAPKPSPAAMPPPTPQPTAQPQPQPQAPPRPRPGGLAWNGRGFFWS